MPHAASLAAAVEREFGVAMLLKVGHDGIMEMRADGSVLYTNESECGVLPTAEELFALIEKLDAYTRRSRP